MKTILFVVFGTIYGSGFEDNTDKESPRQKDVNRHCGT